MTAPVYTPAMRRVSELRLVTLTTHARDDGELAAVEGLRDLPFSIARVFTVRAPAGARRGQHAHRRCAQFMFCPHGAVDVLCEDDAEQRSFALDRAGVGLLVPPTIWASEQFHKENSLLVVVCDRPYEEGDYIRDRAEYLAWRRASDAGSTSGRGP